MPVEQKRITRPERLLAYTGAVAFVALGLAALLLWVREGQLVFVTQILSGIANCL